LPLSISNEGSDPAPRRGIAQGIGHLDEHPPGRHERFAQNLGGRHRGGVMVVGGVEQRDEVKGVREYRVHERGLPWA
jgi:hypothetical protein